MKVALLVGLVGALVIAALVIGLSLGERGNDDVQRVRIEQPYSGSKYGDPNNETTRPYAR